MAASALFDSDRTRKLVVTILCGALLVGSVAIAWAVSGASLRTLVPIGSRSKVNFAASGQPGQIKLTDARLGPIAVKVPQSWQPVNSSPAYLANTQNVMLQDPRHPQRWLVVAQVDHPLPRPKVGPDDVTLIRTVNIPGRGQYLFHLHDQVDSAAQVQRATQAYRPMFERICRSARPIRTDHQGRRPKGQDSQK